MTACKVSKTFCKNYLEILDYGWDWSQWLQQEIIVSSLWTVDDPGLTIGVDFNTDTLAWVYLSDGTLGVNYIVTNKIVTNAAIPRTATRAFIIQTRNR